MASISKRISTRVVLDKKSGRETTVTIERYRARYRDEAGKEHARHFVKKANAQRWLDEVTAAVVRGDYVDPAAGKVTFGQWFRRWSEAQTWTDGTAETATMTLASVTFADVPMSRITELHVEAWMKAMTKPGPKRKKGLAASTRRTRYNYVRMAFLAAVKARVIRQDPTAGISPPRVAKSEGRIKLPTPEQVGAALQEAPDSFHGFVAVCAFAGLRLGEAAGLQLGDVDFLRRTLSIQRQIQGQVNAKTVEVSPKYESARTVYLPDDLVTVLAAHLEKCPPMGEERWVFSLNGYVYNRNSAGNQWRNLRAKVGMDAFTLHDLRHFFASGLIADGCDVVTVQHALGPSSASITLNVYSHLWPKAEDRTRAAAANLMAATADPADSVRTLASS
ncbi:site-specific integrase [Nocardioides sp.]|uniref:tyrosine-type recombinase/integrase n=1 Tax=Nocardioides sp. TaxID=35761 RepID=UPI002CF5879B|nr:site-specific integrase [Nocardioides sp.]HXH79270.1 site-specific integrase [Nocardioides sp.]